MPSAPISYRACFSLEDFQHCVQLQRDVWGFDELEVLPTRVFVVAAEIGGQVFLASQETPGRPAQPVGFLLALPGIRRNEPFLHSHMLGVLQEYRDAGIGRKLKTMQRDDALSRGIGRIEWTFDPLELKNAFFNIARLGAIVRRYVPNRYGSTTSGLHAGMPTDRLVAEWWLDTARVRESLEGRAPGFPAVKRIEVPADIAEIKKRDQKRALEVQARIRDEFQQAFAAGLTVAGFDRQGAYLLTSGVV